MISLTSQKSMLDNISLLSTQMQLKGDYNYK